MGKSKRKKKIKEQDFKKVKLRVGKKLSQAQNVTDRAFVQIESDCCTALNKSEEPRNQRRQSLKVRNPSFR